MRTYTDAKAMAKSLRNSLAAKGISLSHSECLETVAKQFGFADWNTFSAKSQSVPQASAPEHLSCSFCGKLPHEIRTLIEGGCSRRGASPCVFICDECIAFGAQINAGSLDSAADQT